MATNPVSQRTFRIADQVTNGVVIADRRELVARVEGIERRANVIKWAAVPLVRVGDLCISPPQRSATLQGSPLTLTPKELALLIVLAQHAGEVLSRSDLFEALWEGDLACDARLVDGQIMKLRRRLKGGQILIETVWRRGYRLVAPDATAR